MSTQPLTTKTNANVNNLKSVPTSNMLMTTVLQWHILQCAQLTYCHKHWKETQKECSTLLKSSQKRTLQHKTNLSQNATKISVPSKHIHWIAYL